MPLQFPEGTQEVTNTLFILKIEFICYINTNVTITPAPTWSNTSGVIGWLQHQLEKVFFKKKHSCGFIFSKL